MLWGMTKRRSSNRCHQCCQLNKSTHEYVVLLFTNGVLKYLNMPYYVIKNLSAALHKTSLTIDIKDNNKN